jgi:acyl-CoA synthetase (AMP-forming)/AMP-acid ligase II
VNLWTTLEHAARSQPERASVVDGGRAFSYPEVRARAAALATFLREQGLAEADRVAILAWNGHEFLEAYFAAAGAGLILVPLNVRLSARELAEIVRDSGARWLIAQDEFGQVVAGVQGESSLEGVLWIGRERDDRAHAYERAIASCSDRVSAFAPSTRGNEDVAHLYYTSGTTGVPKGVMLTHKNVLVHAQGTIDELGLSDRDTWAHVAPMFHLADAWATFAITMAGGKHVMLARFEAEKALDVLERERVTITNLVPTMLNLMVKHPSASERDWSALRAILSGGAPIAPDVVRAIVDTFGCDYVQTYGMTETSPFLTMSLLKDHLRTLPPEEQLAFKCKAGRAFATIRLRVVGADGLDVEDDEQSVGEIRVRGETVTPGYWNKPNETKAAFQDGWLKTGDLAVIDREGYVTIVDRAKDMILTGGENVYSTEVEHALYAHLCVLEAAVFGVPDDVYGESVRAAVVLRVGKSAGAEELIAFCRSRLAAFKCPRAIDFVDELPRTGSGKIMKRALRDPYWDGRAKKV